MINKIVSYVNPFSQDNVAAREAFCNLSEKQQIACVAASAISFLAASYFSLLVAPFIGGLVFRLIVELSDQMKQVNHVGTKVLHENKKEKGQALAELTNKINAETLSKSLPLINAHLIKHPEDVEDWKEFWNSLTGSNDSKVCAISQIKIPVKVLRLQSQIANTMIQDLQPIQDEIEMSIDLEINKVTLKTFFTCLERGFIGKEINSNNAKDFLILADHFDIEWAISVSKKFMINNATNENILGIYNFLQEKNFLGDESLLLCLKKLAERFKNPDHIQELIEQFDKTQSDYLQNFLSENHYNLLQRPQRVALLCLFLPKIINSDEKIILPHDFLTLANLNSTPLISRLFDMLCPIDSMTIFERCHFLLVLNSLTLNEEMKGFEKNLANQTKEERLEYVKGLLHIQTLISDLTRDVNSMATGRIVNFVERNLYKLLTDHRLWMVQPLIDLVGLDSVKFEVTIFFIKIQESKKTYTPAEFSQFIAKMATQYPLTSTTTSLNRMFEILESL